MKGFRMKKVLSIILMVVLLFTSFIKVPVLAEPANEQIKITILATSDIHGRYMPWDYALDAENKNGSLSQLYTLVKEIREENPNTVLVDVGDLIQDNSSELFQEMDPHPAMLAINKMGYDSWTMGNHEFDYGLTKLDGIAKQFTGGVLAGNMYKESGEQYFSSYKVVERQGIKVGIIGMTTPMVAEFKEGTDTFNGVAFTSPTEETKKAIKDLEGKADVLIGVMHMGIENENGVANTGLTDIANANPELSVIFGGHMHKLHAEELVNNVLIAEPDKYATHLSRVDLIFEKKNDKYVLIERKGVAVPVKKSDGSMTQSDKELEAILLPFHEIARKDANTIIGELKGLDLVPKNEIIGIPSVQIQETPLTNFFSDVMLYYSNGADVVAHQIDTDKANLNVGPIKKKDIAFNYQYAGGEVTVYKVTGKDLKDYMEWSAGYFNSSKPGDVTISFDKTRRASKYSTNDIFGGIKYEIDLSKSYGNRITNIRRIDETPITLDEEIKLGLNAYRMKALIGKGGALEGRVFEKIYSTQQENAFGEVEGRIRSLAARYIKEVKNGVLDGKLNNYWKIIGVDTGLPLRQDVIELVNLGILEIPKTADGKYTNIASININEEISIDGIKALAEKAGVSFDSLIAINNAGDIYKALNKLIKEKNVDVIEVVQKPKQEIYIVKPGDSLYRIAAKFQKDWKDVAEYNAIKNPHLIYPGQKIVILLDNSIVEEKPSTPKQEIYIVKSGDSLYMIAAKFQKNWRDIAKYNAIKNPYLIYPGQKIVMSIN